MTVPVITVDGVAAAGKGTLARRLAEHYRFHFLDSGVLYRSAAYLVLQRGIAGDAQGIATVARQMRVTQREHRVWIDDDEVTEAIRTPAVDALSSTIATLPQVREALLVPQRAAARPPGLVADGRDMGTVVFPQAVSRLFLQADAHCRAVRRLRQLNEPVNDNTIERFVQMIVERDAQDASRATAPLRPSVDALVIDTTAMTPDEVFVRALTHVDNCLHNLS